LYVLLQLDEFGYYVYGLETTEQSARDEKLRIAEQLTS